MRKKKKKEAKKKEKKTLYGHSFYMGGGTGV